MFYSGVILYRMLHGRLPFPSDSSAIDYQETQALNIGEGLSSGN